MSRERARGQAMVEVAIGVAIFLTATLGSVQLGLSAFSSEGTQSAALLAARSASGTPVPGAPVARLEAGQQAAVAELHDSLLGLASVHGCPIGADQDACGLPSHCALYHGSEPVSGSAERCPAEGVGSSQLGPGPSELDGSQDPACHGGGCFGVAASMQACASAPPAGTLRVCLAYTGWPATAVDVWVRGGLRSVVPLLSGAGVDVLPVDVRLRLQVESLA